MEAGDRDETETLHELERAVESYIRRRRAGERPLIAEFVRRFPERGEEVRDLLSALAEVEDLGEEPVAGAALVGRDAPGRGGPTRLGDYVILREIGRGGMAVVYEAEQESLGRRVALKVLPLERTADARRVERFLREARAAAGLQHKNIVPIFAVGEDQGFYFFAMQLIRGSALHDVLTEVRRLREAESTAGSPSPGDPDSEDPRTTALRFLTDSFPRVEVAREGLLAPEADEASGGSAGDATPSSDGRDVSATASLLDSNDGGERRDVYYKNVARVALQVAEALEYAHGEGILHRDIKPSNLLFDIHGNTWVGDFGLAKIEGIQSLTHSGDVLGTVPYMAPERFSGWSDPRSDVYSLGVTLFEMATLSRAFGDEDPGRLIERVSSEEPLVTRKSHPDIPRDLETIILKAADKEPVRRYGSARELADDLRRYLDDQPVLARRTSTLHRAFKWAKRKKAIAALIAVSLLALVGLAAGALWHSVQLRAALGVSEDRRQTGNRHLYQAQTRLAQQSWDESNVDHAIELLERQTPEAGEEDLRAFEWHLLWAMCHQSRRLWSIPGRYFRAVEVSPDGRVVATGSEDGAVLLWDSEGQHLLETLGGHRSPVTRICFSTGGEVMASVGEDGTVILWDVARGTSLRELEATAGNGRSLGSLHLSPDAALLAIGMGVWDEPGGELLLWNAGSGELLWRQETDSTVTGIDFSPDGRSVVHGELEGREITLRETRSGAVERLLPAPGGGTWDLCFSPRGDRLAASSHEESSQGRVFVYELPGGEVVRTFGAPRSFVDFSPDGELLAFGSPDVIVWDLDRRRERRRLRGCPGPNDGRFLTDGVTFAIKDGTRAVEFWNLESRPDPEVWSLGGPIVDALSVSGDGELVAAGLKSGSLELRSTSRDSDSATYNDVHRGGVSSLVFSRQSGRLISGGRSDISLKVWEVGTGPVTARVVEELPFDGRAGWTIVSCGGGTLVAGVRGKGEGLVGIWRENGRRFELVAERNWPSSNVAVTDDGGLIALANSRGEIAFVTRASLSSTESLSYVRGHHGLVRGMAFSRDARWLATASHDSSVKIWDVAQRRPVETLRGHPGQVWCVAFFADGSRFASAGRHSTIRIWDTTDWLEVAALHGHREPVTAIAFHPDGEALISAAYDGTVRIWRAPRR